jgi:two-component system, OmpR family, phosphate regulon sensor histidine kinase PhoR
MWTDMSFSSRSINIPGEGPEIMVEKVAAIDQSCPTVLVIDDEERVREGCRKVLARDGYEVTIANSGEIGLKMIERQHYDIILLDLMMPSLSGFDVLAHVKALHPDTVIIVISGYATVENSIEAMKRGAFDFIPKPFSPEQLRVLTRKAIQYTRAMQDIADEKSRTRVLINRLMDGVMATDADKRVVLANPAFLRMAGCREVQVVGRPVSEVVQYEQIEGMIERALAMAGDDFAELSEEIYCEAEAGQTRQILNARCIPYIDRAGRNMGTVTMLHDITTLKRVDQIKSEFVSMVSHEIRSPLNSVLAQIKIILDGLAGEVTEKQQEILSRASDKVKSLVNLSSELLDLARIESGLISQEKEQLNLSEILTDQIAFHGPKAQAKKISLILEPLPDLSSVVVDRRNMEEVFSNLISNAINYTPEGGKVAVSAAMEGGYLKASVSDNGIGMASEDLNNIFNRFYRIKNDKTRFIIGTGLGLAITKSIVEAHNGFIRVESKPDHGSTFHVYIPCPGS